MNQVHKRLQEEVIGKNMLDTKYDFKNIEENKYNNWKEKGYFKAGAP